MASSSWITPGGVNNNTGTLTFPQGTQLTETALGTLAMVSAATTNQFQIPNGALPEYLMVGWGSNQANVGGVNNGGTARNCSLNAGNSLILSPNNGVNAWFVNTSGHLLDISDNARDIGAVGATRPRTVYAGTSMISPAYTVGSTAGASGTGTVLTGLTVVNGIVTAITIA